jgi:hypothetical protein
MRVLAGGNSPRPAVAALRKAGRDVFSSMEECPGVSDDDVATLCEEQQRILLTFDKNSASSFFAAGCPLEAGSFCFASRPTIRKRRRKQH